MKRSEMLTLIENQLKNLVEQYTNDIVLDMELIEYFADHILDKQEHLGMLPPDNSPSNFEENNEWDSEK